MPGTVVAWHSAARGNVRPAKQVAPSGKPEQASASPLHESVQTPHTH